MPAPARSHTRGFTLIEVVVVVAVLGILALTALPNLINLGHKNKRVEAYSTLHGISVAQTAHHREKGRYGETFDEIGFVLAGAVVLDPSTIQGPHYTYTLTTFEWEGVPNGNYRATASGDIDPSDPVLDILIIENQLVVEE